MLSARERLILLNLIPDVGSIRLRRLLDHFGDLERVWAAGVHELQQVQGIGPQVARRLFAGCRNERPLHEDVGLAHRAGVEIVTLEDAGYPQALRVIPDPPLALYYRGMLTALEALTVAVVGSRHASLYGLETAQRLSRDLAERGVTVVSGLARGIDSAAHRGALSAQGRTVAVLGNGLSRIYPSEHETLAKQMTERGAVISEYPMAMAPLAQNFPRRNRLISGLSGGVVVVEAAPRSGALITVDCALEQGREVFAVPGPITRITSQGTHQLLKQGAALVTSVEDILEVLQGLGQPATPARSPEVPVNRIQQLAEPEERVFACLRADAPRDIDAIAADAALAPGEVSSWLLQLEVKRLVQQLPGKQFLKTS